MGRYNIREYEEQNKWELMDLLHKLVSQLTEKDKEIRDKDAELFGVMHSVDKWFDEDDPRLKDNEATRASYAREIALRAIESRDAKIDRLKKALHLWKSGILIRSKNERL